MRLLSDPKRRFLVGTLDESVVGFATGRLDPVGEAAIGLVDALYVDPSSRHKGVGRKLLGALVAWFTSSGARAVDASALPGDRETKNFFESTGFKGRLIVMHRDLG